MSWIGRFARMNVVRILKGLPASGKTTLAKKLEKQGWLRINKDEIREYLGKYKSETKVIAIRNDLLDRALDIGKKVVIDDTNLHPKHEKEIRKIVGNRATIEVVKIDVPPKICIERDSKRDKPVGAPVIWSIWNKYLKEKNDENGFINS